MKTIIILLLSFFFANVSFTQYVEKKKQAPKEETRIDSSTVADFQEEQKTETFFVPKPKLSEPTYKSPLHDNKEKGKLKKMEDYYPPSNILASGSWINETRDLTMSMSGMKVKGFYLNLRVYQSTFDKKKDMKKPGRKWWGLEGEYGKYNITIQERDRNRSASDIFTDIKVTQMGLGVAFAFAKNRPYFNTFTLSFKATKELEEGNSGLYQWEQNDYALKSTVWGDLTKNKELFFSAASYWLYYNYIIQADRTALYDGQPVPSKVWDKTSYGIGLNVTLLRFYLGGDLGLHFGLSGAYEHYNQNSQDLYTPGGFIELHGYEYKIASLEVGKRLSSLDPTISKPSRVTTLKLSIDLWQIYNYAIGGMF